MTKLSDRQERLAHHILSQVSNDQEFLLECLLCGRRGTYDMDENELEAAEELWGADPGELSAATASPQLGACSMAAPA